MKKRILSMLLAIVMVATLLPTAAFAAETPYALYICGVQVTSDNLVIDSDDNAAITGSAKYDSNANTLTLDEFTYDGAAGDFDYGNRKAVIGSKLSDLTILLKGENTITATDSCGIFSTQNLAICDYAEDSSVGSLNANAPANAVSVVQDLTITGVNLTVTSTEEIPIYPDSLTITNANVSATGAWGALCAENDITITNSKIEAYSTGEDPTFDPAPDISGTYAVYAGEDAENADKVNAPTDELYTTSKYVMIVPSQKHTLCQTANCTIDHNGNASGTGHADADKITFTPVTTQDELQDAATNGGSVYLAKDIELDETITVTGTLNLCLNGKKLYYTGSGNVSIFTVAENATLNITDCGTTVRAGYVEVDGEGDTLLWNEGDGDRTNDITYNLVGGLITDGTGTVTSGTTRWGGAVYAQAGATVNLYGGNIAGNSADYGGCIHGVDCTMNMYGGSIVGNIVGGIHLTSDYSNNIDNSLNIHGGNIEYNLHNGYSASEVGVTGTITMTGGTVIAENTMVAMHGADGFTMTGGTVINYAQVGVAVSVQDTWADLSGGTISAPNDGIAVSSSVDPLYMHRAGDIRLSGAPVLEGDAADISIMNGKVNGESGDYQNHIVLEGPLTGSDPYTVAVSILTWDTDEYGDFIYESLEIDENPTIDFTKGWSTHMGNASPEAYFKNANSAVGAKPISLINGELWLATTYTVTVTANPTEHGTVAADPDTAAEGETVTITTTPNNGYVVDTVSVTKTDGVEAVEVSGTGNTRTFTMPAEAVIVSVTFREIVYNGTVSNDSGAMGGVEADGLNTVANALDKNIVLTVEPEAASSGDSEQTAIKGAAGSRTLEFLDITLEDELGNFVEVPQGTVLEIKIPFTVGNKQNITVYRHHNGTAAAFTALNTKPAVDARTDATFYVDSANNCIYVYTNQFSTYAIGYTVPSPAPSGGSYTPTYAITVEKGENGTVKTDRSYASSGSTVTITATPKDGYVVDTVTVTDSQGSSIEVTRKNDGTYTFKMPGRKVTVEAVFVPENSFAACTGDSGCPMYGYTDLNCGAWYHDGVHYCIDNGLMSGYGNGIFKPDADTTRAMIIVMLWRLNGSPVVNYLLDFEDVAEGQWYTEAIRWAKSEGIAGGYGNGYFGTNDAITREQMVTILWRYAQHKDIDVSVGEDTNILSYNDAFDVAEYAIPAMQWACGSGMVQGMNAPDGEGMILAPKSKGTRAQIATMLMRFCTEIVK